MGTARKKERKNRQNKIVDVTMVVWRWYYEGKEVMVMNFFFFFFFFFVFLSFLGPNPLLMEVPRLGVELEL